MSMPVAGILYIAMEFKLLQNEKNNTFVNNDVCVCTIYSSTNNSGKGYS
jgi:hypothetical protein